ncbi:hypothetical protein HPB52_018335 [Rhipicephalus sanguineus]|uniref:Uncharacterized protein n=1 Tax=Rhipicephalus sanguineus TaxID=34632 RepID=A0A9D4QA31_RHISA|nr:hypothetical protein HPB52_018335 [Rhipicephalus sanguineus]
MEEVLLKESQRQKPRRPRSSSKRAEPAFQKQKREKGTPGVCHCASSSGGLTSSAFSPSTPALPESTHLSRLTGAGVSDVQRRRAEALGNAVAVRRSSVVCYASCRGVELGVAKRVPPPFRELPAVFFRSRFQAVTLAFAFYAPEFSSWDRQCFCAERAPSHPPPSSWGWLSGCPKRCMATRAFEPCALDSERGYYGNRATQPRGQLRRKRPPHIALVACFLFLLLTSSPVRGRCSEPRRCRRGPRLAEGSYALT